MASTAPHRRRRDAVTQTPAASAGQACERSLPADVLGELELALSRVQNAAAAERVWQRLFTEEHRQRLGNDLEESYTRLRTVGMWQQAHGVSAERAIIEVARGVNLMSAETADWLLRELGEVDRVPTPDRPVWDVRTGELRFEGDVIRRLRVMGQPSNIQRILDAFQAAGWPRRIENPLPHGQQQLHQALRYLNRGLQVIRFRSQEGGSAVIWERC